MQFNCFQLWALVTLVQIFFQTFCINILEHFNMCNYDTGYIVGVLNIVVALFVYVCLEGVFFNEGDK